MMVQQTNTTTSRRQLPVAVWVGLVGTLLVALLEVVRNPTASRNYVRRRLSGVPESSTFKFDGSSSDLAQQFYHRHVAGDTADPIKIDHDDLPDRIRQRLDDENLRFDKLPPLLQRALVWDSGFAMDPGPTPALVQIHTVDGVPMSDIAVPVDDFRNFGCTTSNCSDPNGMAAFRSKNCTGDQMLPSVRCASDAMTYKYTHTSMWATGGSDSIIPDFTVLRHGWTDPVNNTDYVVYAIHTTPVENEPSWDKCPSRNQYSTLIIPCDVFASSHIPKNWQLPAFGDIVVPWIKEIKASDRRRQILMYAILPLGVVVAFGLIAGAFLIAYSRRHPESGVRKWWTCGRGRSGLRSKSHTILTGSSSLQHTLLTPPPPHPPKRTSTASSSSPPPLNGPLSAPFPLPRTSSTSSMLSSPPPAPLRPRRPSSSLSEDTANMATTDRMVHILINDPHMCDKRLALERIHFQTLLSKGAFGEVWLCALDGHKVAVKRLLSSHRAVLEDVEAFTDEIQIMAALHHPHIPKFLGVAWTTLDQLCMVTEYMDGGDLQSFLKTNGHLLNWPQQKKTIALGIAKALMYLHSRAPVLIHRDIKSRNILVKEQPTLTAKVTDFGVTRSVQQRRECMMTLGVGTPYWTAPEVLDGTSYTEKSDIYSFGVVLSEIDTCQSPYHDVQYGSDSGIHLQPFHILKMVMAGTIQPRFSATCPMAVRELATKCLTFNPASRPTARELVTALEQMQWDQE